MDFPVSQAFVDSANAAQLHDAAQGAEPNWPASFVKTESGWVYRVDNPGIRSSAQIQAAIDAHVPDPDWMPPGPEKNWRDKLRAEVAFIDSQLASWPTNASSNAEAIARANFLLAATKRLARNQKRILQFIDDATMDSDA